MKQNTYNMATQNYGLAASGMRHAEIAAHNAFGRLFLTLLMMLLTTATAWAEEVMAVYALTFNTRTQKTTLTHNGGNHESVTWDYISGTNGTPWNAGATHGVDDEYDITFKPNKALTLVNYDIKTSAETRFTVTVGDNAYYIKSATIGGKTETAGLNAKTIDVTVPDGTSIIAFSVTLIRYYTVTPASGLHVTSGTSATSGGTTYYKPGTTVTIAPTSQYHIVEGTGGIGSASASVAADKRSFSFTMPEQNVSPTATLTEVYQVTPASGITLSPAAHFTYGSAYYYKPNTTITLSSNVPTGQHVTYKASYNNGNKTLPGNTYTVNSTDHDVTLSALLEYNTYTVRFNGNGSTTGSMSNQGFTYGTAQNLRANAYRRAFTVTYHYNEATGGNSQTTGTATATFNGWATTASGAKVYDNGQSVSNLSTENNATVDLFAKWTDGSVTLPTPTRTGYTFAGWYSDEGLTASVGGAGASYTPSANITLYAKWTINKYTISFDTNGGTPATIAPIYQNYGTAVTAPADPTRTGYTFAGWSPALPSTMPAGDLTVTAQWTAHTYTVQFNGNGSTGGSMDAQSFTYDVTKALTANAFSRAFTVTYAYNEATGDNSESTGTATATFNGWAESENGEKVYDDGQSVSNLSTENNATVNLFAKWTDGSVTLPTPTKTGYTFGGWYSDSGLNTSVGDGGASYTPSEDITIYAKWTANQYTISFNTNGGTPATIADIKQDYGTAITAPADPTREGYDFAGWNPALPTTMPAGDMTVTAQWNIVNYPITYHNLDGGTLTTDYNSYTVESATITLDEPTRTGYTFDGWYANEGLTGPAVTTIAHGSTGKVDLYAKWTINQYTLSFDTNGGTPATIDAITQDYGTAITAPADPERTGYTFEGWNPALPTTMPAGDLTVTAQWSIVNYPINYHNLDGATLNTDYNSYTVESATITLDEPTRTGYTFDGWYANEGLTGPAVTTIAHASTGKVELWAKWTINKYTISFDTNGGTPATIDAITQDYDTPITAPADPTREYYTFEGWNPEIPATMPAGDLTVTAQWTPISYAITYNLNGGTLDTDYNSYTVESATITLDEPTRKGYTFVGWYDNAKLKGTTVTSIAHGSTGEVELWAKWTIVTYTITCNLDGGTLANPNRNSYNVETPTFTLNNPSKTGYTFIGWTGYNGSTPQTTITISQGSTEDREYTANYEPASFTVGDLSYQWTSGTEVKVISCNSSAKSATIPATVSNDGVTYSVTAIDATAFSACTSLVNLFIRSTTPPALGANAFAACTALSYIGVPLGTIEAYQAAAGWAAYAGKMRAADGSCGADGSDVYYAYDSSTTTLSIFGTGTMKDYGRDTELPWYSYYKDITTVVISHGVTAIGQCAFYECSGLTSITIPASVTSIGINAIRGCTSLTSIDIPTSVTSIGQLAFSGCSGLTSITIPNGVTTIDRSTFSGCSSLTSVTLPASVTTIGMHAFSGCSSLTSIALPTDVTTIGSYAFYECSSLTTVNIPDGVTIIDEKTFDRCTSLTSINIPDGVTTIGFEAFYMCSGLASIHIPAAVTSIGGSAFYDCSGLESITVASGNTNYDSRNDCNAIIETATNKLIKGGNKTVIPDGVTTINRGAFINCTGLKSITIPASVTSIVDSPFSGCTGVESISVADGNKTFDSRDNCNAIIKTDNNTLIAGCMNTIIPNSVTSIGQSAFERCASLTNITIPDGVTTIGSLAFYDCTGLTSITIPASVTTIDGTAFEGCTSLTNITILDGATTIPAFARCTSLTSITIPDGVTSIPDGAFNGCTALTSITIPASVTSIGRQAFSGCTSLPGITLPSKLATIGSQAFYGCTSLTGLTIPGSVTSIGSQAFNGCTHLASIEILDGVTSISSEAFRECTGLTSITLPGSLTSINSGAFYGCTGLTSITIPAGVTSIGNEAFKDCTSMATVSVAAENETFDSRDNCHAIIKTATNTLILGFKNSVIPDGVTAIGDHAFYECSGLTSIEIPAGVTSIGNNAFDKCTGLTSIEIPASMTSIGDHAFAACYGLTSVTIYAPPLDYDGEGAFGANADGRKIYVYSNYVDTYRSYASHMGAYWGDIQPIESMSLNDAADNSALITEADGATLDVTLQGRTLTKDGNWNTLCLPFSLSLGQIADEHSPLHDAVIKEMDNTAEGTSLDNGTLTLKFNTVYDPTDLSTGSIEAGKPYIVKWTKPDGYDENPGNYNIVNPVFLDVTISDTTPEPVVSNDNHVTFVGQYSPFVIDDSNINSVIMLGAKNTLGYSKNPRQLHSFRAHFEVPTHTGAPAMNSYVIDFGDDETGISLTPDPSPRGEGSEYYTLDGRKLDGKPTKKGMYIVNGRKVVIK